ncbi:protoporphyrinogen oxidase [Endozoicomonas sp. (ex Bugula neritina AB1)]|nr:protoporphyrinogen oxidase [Endozoicomonas sp. (ex Bugula neritina AB1)]
MSHLALLYMTREGQARKVMERIAYCLEEVGHRVSIAAINDLPADYSLEAFDGVVLGCSIRYGRHHKLFCRFVEKHRAVLEQKPNFFFSINLTARKPNRSEPHNNLYLQKFLKKSGWAPTRVDVFAGALLYTRYRFLDRLMIQLIMRITNGPTDPSKDTEFTNWSRVKRFADTVSSDMQRLSEAA